MQQDFNGTRQFSQNQILTITIDKQSIQPPTQSKSNNTNSSS